jgi:hypothetical protein
MFINAYLPYDSVNKETLLLEYNGKLSAIVREVQAQHVRILGDFNAHHGSRTYNEWTRVLADVGMEMVDVALLPANSYTHQNYNGHSGRWLDHVAATPALRRCVLSCDIGAYTSSSDHFPLEITLKLSALPALVAMETGANNNKVNWQFQDHERTTLFSQNLDLRLDSVDSELLIINKVSDHSKLDALFEFLQRAIFECGASVFGWKSSDSSRAVPEWNRFLANKHNRCVSAYNEWG